VRVGLGEQLARGSRSAVFAWGRGAVAKVPFTSTPDRWIHFEARYTAAVHDAGAPAPRLLGIETVNRRAASIYERVDGRSMWDHMLGHPGDVRALTRSLAELQIHLFTLVPPVSVPALQDRLTCKIRRASRLVDPALAAALALIPSDRSSRLCHGDLHPGNVIMSARGPILIDWFDVARGNPLGDIARSSLLMWARAHGTDGPRHLPGSDPRLLELVHDSYVDAITLLDAPDPTELRRWEAVAAVARVAEGVAIDALRGIWSEWRSTSSIALDVGH
jgi:aminoglycoside phosphotransferase (APT) family kinase protein